MAALISRQTETKTLDTLRRLDGATADEVAEDFFEADVSPLHRRAVRDVLRHLAARGKVRRTSEGLLFADAGE